MKTRFVFIFSIITVISGHTFAQSHLTNGVWRGVITNQNHQEIPFNFLVSDQSGKKHIAIINSTERFQVSDISQKGDSVFIHMPLFDSEFRLKWQNDALVGKWIRHLGDHNDEMAFKATPNTPWRFLPTVRKQKVEDITGRWSATFVDADKKKDVTVGEFIQYGEKLTGTFREVTGDYRYLEGMVNGDQMYLSCFDGAHAFAFTGKIVGNKIVDGKFNSGLKGFYTWTAFKDANAKLPDAYSLTGLKRGYKTVSFSFPDLNGHKVSLNDKQFKNKVVILQMMGSWCPNCMDETNYFVSDYYKKYHSKGVEIIGLAYERTTDFKKSQHTLAQLKQRFDMPYPILVTGYTPAAGDQLKSLPQLANFMGFPTTIIIDKKGNVAKIHTGFDGPGTGVHYTEFKKEFEGLTDKLLAEK